MSKNTILINKTITIVIAFILLICCWQAIKMGKANLDFYSAHQLTEFWQDNNLKEANQYSDALQAIDSANVEHPDNPLYIVTEGLVYEWGTIAGMYDDEQQKWELLTQAKSYYLNAAKLRPTWPVTWATLAILKWRMEEIDQQLIDYLKQADKYGPYVMEVHQAWLEMGFYLYQSKSQYSVQIIKGLRKHLREMLRQPNSPFFHSAIAIIKRHKAERLACSWLSSYEFDTEKQRNMLCQ